MTLAAQESSNELVMRLPVQALLTSVSTERLVRKVRLASLALASG